MARRANIVSRVIAGGIIAAFAALVLAVLVPLLGARIPGARPSVGDSVEAANQSIITIDQPLQLSAQPAITVTKGVFFAGPRPTHGPRALVLDQPAFDIDLTAKVIDDNDSVEAASNALAIPIYQQLFALGFDAIDVKRGSAKVRWAGGEEETVSDINTKVTPRKNGLLSWEGTLVARGQQLSIEATVGPPGRITATGVTPRVTAVDKTQAPNPHARNWPLRVTVRGTDLFARLEGSAVNINGVEVEGIADISIPRVANFARWQGIGWSTTTGATTATLRGPITWRAGALSFQTASFAIDGQEGSGALTFRYRNGRPLIEGTLALENFNAGALLRTAVAPGGPATTPQPLPSWHAIQTAFPSILAVDADLRVSAKRLLMDATPVGRAVAAFTVRDGVMHADIAEIDVGLAHGSVQLTVDMTKAAPVYAVRSRFDTANADWLTEPLVNWPAPRGSIRGTVELTGAGVTVGELLKAARGKINLSAPDGAKLPLDLRALRDHVQKSKATEVHGWGASAIDTFFEEVEIKAQIDVGRLVFDSVALKSKALAISASGKIGLIDKEIGMKMLIGTSAAVAKALSVQRASALTVQTTRVSTDTDALTVIVRGSPIVPTFASIDRAPAP
ncbi:MAG: AsmA-like C-terminal region-containing protein [Hyphomicrobiaceae bacterium]